MGKLAALATSFFWSLNSIQFTLAGRRVGSRVVNRVRLLLAVLFLSVTHLLLYGELWPVHAEPFRWEWLGLSGAIGLVLGDGCLFQALIFIGARRAMLLMTLVPVISTLVAWGWLGEALGLPEIGAVLLTVGGVAWVVSERRRGQANGAAREDKRRYSLGVLLGLGGALGQALGLVTARQGLVGEFPSLSATLIRMLVATAVIWLLTLVQGQLEATWRALGDRKTSVFLLGGSLVGPFLGVWLSMVALQRAPVGIASTLMALSPVILIPLEHWIFREPVSPRTVVGTVLALAGAAATFLI
jgi:drug/metabolite transporter (DMT)-like permease